MANQKKPKIVVPPGKKLIFRPWIKRNGRVVYAAACGLKAWPILVDK